MLTEKEIKESYDRISPYLDERSKRLYIANEALRLGCGGKILVSRVLGVSRVRINAGIKELKGKTPVSEPGKIRRSGGGRKQIIKQQPEIVEQVSGIVSPHTRGDPENPLLWCSKSLRKIAKVMHGLGYKVSHVTIEKILKGLNYSLQANRKTKEGSTEADRDKQFEHINSKAISFMAAKEPVISVDCKKKELIGNCKNTGEEREESKNPQTVNVHDFPDPVLGKAVPYGVYDPAQNQGRVNVGISSDTAQFAVNTIKTRWQQTGKSSYPNATKILITADGGGSNSSVSRLWKRELQSFATESGLEVNVCHFPPGTSKWNKIEHRLFAFITKNWRGKPLCSLETIVNLIANTTTEKGLKVKAVKDETVYQKGIVVSNDEMNLINLKFDDFRGKWNYSIAPAVQ